MPSVGTLALLAGVAAASAGPQGCTRADRGEAPTVAGRAKGGAATAAAPGTTVSEEECRAFAKAVEEAARSGDAAALGALIDWDAILGAATAGIPVPEPARDDFVRGVKSATQQEQGLVPQIVAAVRVGGSYLPLARRRPGGPPASALFRLVTPASEGVNYHEFVLARRDDGAVRAVDVYIVPTGEPVSGTLRRMFLGLAARGDGTADAAAIVKLPEADRAFLENLPRFQRMTADVRDGKPAEALATYGQLPPAVRKDKTALRLRLQAARDAGGEAFSRAIDEFRAAYPGDACVEMFAIDHYLLRRDYPRALACLDRLDRSIGGDPYIHVMRANIHTDQDRLDLARRDADRAIADDPDLQDAYWALLTVTLQEHRYNETATLLDQLAGRFHIPFGDMAQLPIFSEFVRSPEYVAWKGEKR
jgi:tetratricopeptide (TPR) repeat protein